MATPMSLARGEACRKRRARMQSTLAHAGFLPPPAPRALRLPRARCARTGHAANARVVLIVQSVIGKIVCADVLPDLLLTPVEERTQLEEPVTLIPFLGARRRAHLRLFAAHARDPGVEPCDRAPEGLDLAHLAAREPCADALPETVHALLGDQLLERARLRMHQADARPVALLEARQKLVRRLRQAPGVDGEDL